MSHGYEWDERKRTSNYAKHGVDFPWAARVFDDVFAIGYEDDHPDEVRFIQIGMVDGVILFVVFTERGDTVRLISARRATKHEQDAYYRWQR